MNVSRGDFWLSKCTYS